MNVAGASRNSVVLLSTRLPEKRAARVPIVFEGQILLGAFWLRLLSCFCFNQKRGEDNSIMVSILNGGHHPGLDIHLVVRY